mgnify:CR=1 FL=1
MYKGYTGDKEDKQAIFDFIVEKARKQNAISMNRSNTCKYRGPNGLMCFVGFLIPDDKYEQWMDQSSPKCKLINVLEVIGLKDHLSFLSSLQEIHDFSMNVCVWNHEFKKFAEQHNLIYTEDTDAKSI